MGILLVYDVTDEASFSNIRNWMRNIEQHASDNVTKVLVGNKSDMEANRKVPYAKGKALADEYGIMFFETSAKSNINIDEVCMLCWGHMCVCVHERRCKNVPCTSSPCHTPYTPSTQQHGCTPTRIRCFTPLHEKL